LARDARATRPALARERAAGVHERVRDLLERLASEVAAVAVQYEPPVPPLPGAEPAREEAQELELIGAEASRDGGECLASSPAIEARSGHDQSSGCGSGPLSRCTS